MKRRILSVFLLGVLLQGAGGAAGAQMLHRAYIAGFPDGTLRAEAALSREQLAVCLYRLAGEPEGAESAFFDVPRSRWSYRAVSFAAAEGFLPGEADGLYEPARAVSGEELASVFERMAYTEAGNARFFLQELPDADEQEALSRLQSVSRGGFAARMNGLLGRENETADGFLCGARSFSDAAEPATPELCALWEAANDHTYEKTGTGESWTGLG